MADVPPASRPSRRLSALVAVCGLVLLLGASSPAGATSGPALEPPPEIAVVDPVGAAAAALFWVDALNHANRTGDVAPLIRASEYTCGQCSLAVGQVEQRHDAGLVQDGGLVRVVSVAYRGNPQQDLWVLDLVTERSEGTRTAPDGTVEELGLESGLVEAQVVLQEPDLAGERRLVVRSMLPVDQQGLDQ